MKEAGLCDEKTLMILFKMLFKEIKKSAKKQRYPVFNPDKIEVYDKGSIYYENSGDDAGSLRECLRSLGITLYHLATGESGYNDESYVMDGYKKTFDSKLWPVISLMLSGKAYSLVEIEEMMGWRKKIGHRFLRME